MDAMSLGGGQEGVERVEVYASFEGKSQLVRGNGLEGEE